MRSDVTACIPTLPGRETMLARAVKSAEGQAAVIVHPAGDTPRDHAYATWWEAIYQAQTEFVALLMDDDWLAPAFVDRCMELMGPTVAYVVSDGVIHLANGSERRNLGWTPGGVFRSTTIEEKLLGMDLTISPTGCLFRRADALRCLLPGGVPLFRSRPTFPNAGCDLLMLLLPLMEYPLVGFVAEPLVHYDGGEQSTTFQAMQTPEGRAELLAAYRDARAFYQLLRGMR